MNSMYTDVVLAITEATDNQPGQQGSRLCCQGYIERPSVFGRSLR
jgi:hypothetical protein